MVLYGVQLALNLAWQPIFFLLKRPGVAQVDNAGIVGDVVVRPPPLSPPKVSNATGTQAAGAKWPAAVESLSTPDLALVVSQSSVQ